MSTTDDTTDTAADQTTEQGQYLTVEKIYTKDISFESPQAPGIFHEQVQPEVDMQLATNAAGLGDDRYEVVLTVTVTARAGERTVYLAEVQQAGTFVLQRFDRGQLEAVLGSYCPSILFPFARQAIADMVSKGGFPQVLLAPVNFDALYAQHLEQQREPDEAGPSGEAG